MDIKKQRQCRRDDTRLTKSGNARSEQLLVMPTESLTNREWLLGELLSGLECRRAGWFLDMKYQTCYTEYARNCVRIESSNVCKSNVNFCSGLLGPQKCWIQRPCGLFELQASHTENIIISQWWLEPINQLHAAWWFGFAHLSMSYTNKIESL